MLKKKLLARSRELTLPDERYRSVAQTRDFLWRLAGGEFPRTPKAVREQAAGLLRHYPSRLELDDVSHYAPHIFTKHLDPLYKMIKVHEMGESVKEDMKPDVDH